MHRNSGVTVSKYSYKCRLFTMDRPVLGEICCMLFCKHLDVCALKEPSVIKRMSKIMVSCPSRLWTCIFYL